MTEIRTTTIGAQQLRRPPIPDSPLAEILIGANEGLPVGVVHVTVPPGAGMSEHDHGDSTTLLVPLAGSARLTDAGADDRVTALEPGTVTLVPVGRRVRVDNPGSEDARLLVVFSPPDFARGLEAWPPA